jgi:acyl-CoA reductase-like NAD-dependent aldehyde dehydrogenase
LDEVSTVPDIDSLASTVRSAKTFDRINPLDGSVASTAPACDLSDVQRIADAAAAAFESWASLGPNARRAMLSAAADALAAKVDDFVAVMMAEIGATEGWVRFNHMLAVSMIREAASLTTQVGGDVIPSDKPGCIAMAIREPAGVVLGIAPWNAPIILGVRAIALPLACGNTVILKASEQCPQTHSLIVDAFTDAGFPDGVVNIVTNAPADASVVVGALIDHPAVRRINFTGSTAVGRIIAKRAAEHLKPVLLELGGKAPLIVLDDADLDEAVKAAAFGAFMNQGQICMSTERIIVDDAVAEAFVEKFRAKVATLTVGDPRSGQTPLGAVVDVKSVSHVQELVEDALGAGAVLTNGGDARGVLMPAHVVDKVTPDMKLFREESFGPVVGITRARGETHAIELANDTEYGLSAAVFTRDTARGLRVARAIKSGICHINGPTVHDEAQMPFGGVKGSGYGRFGGKAGIDSFTELRWITIETQAGHFPI